MHVHLDIVVKNKLGLHARAATKLVKLCQRYESHITLSKAQQSVDCKSIMGVLMLAATQGTQLTLQAQGDDAQEAANQVADLFARLFDEAQ